MADEDPSAVSGSSGLPAAVHRRRPNVGTSNLEKAAREVAERLALVLELEGFAGWDPWDALSSPVLRRVAVARVPRLVVINAVKRFPFNVRPLLGVPRRRHTKALALLASAYTRLADVEPGSRYRAVARDLAAAVAERAVTVNGGVGWGYDFDVQTRWSFYPAGQPNAVVTTYAAHALLDVEGHESLVANAKRFALAKLLVEAGQGRYFAYFEGSRTPIHNANLLVAGLVARVGNHDEPGWRAAEDAVMYSLARQRADGSWPYGEAPGLEWVDGYHTVYVLENLARWHRVTGDPDVLQALRRGLDVYIERLIDPDGGPRATLKSRYPLDCHAAASAITGLCALRGYDDRAVPTAERILVWALAVLLRSDGRFGFQRGRYVRNSIPYVRWNDAHMLLALASYLTSCRDERKT